MLGPGQWDWILGISSARWFVPHILTVSVAQFGTDYIYWPPSNTVLVIELTSLLKNEDPDCLNHCCSISSIGKVSIEHTTLQ